MKKIILGLILLSSNTVFANNFNMDRNFNIHTNTITTKSNIIYKREELINATVNINTINELTNSLNACNTARGRDQENNNEIIKLLIINKK
jgi:hypothetical protein